MSDIVVKLGSVPDPVCIIGKMEICLQEQCPYGMWDGQRCLAVGKKRRHLLELTTTKCRKGRQHKWAINQK